MESSIDHLLNVLYKTTNKFVYSKVILEFEKKSCFFFFWGGGTQIEPINLHFSVKLSAASRVRCPQSAEGH